MARMLTLSFLLQTHRTNTLCGAIFRNPNLNLNLRWVHPITLHICSSFHIWGNYKSTLFMVTETGCPCFRYCSRSPAHKPEDPLSEEEMGNPNEPREKSGDGEEDVMRPRPRKERIKQSLAKLKKGPDGRFINVLEVASDVNLLIAAYQNLKAQERPTYLIEDSDDEDSMDGINLERFKKLQKRLRTGTYKFGTAKDPEEN